MEFGTKLMTMNTLKTAFRAVIAQGEGTNRDKAIVFLTIATPALIIVLSIANLR